MTSEILYELHRSINVCIIDSGESDPLLGDIKIETPYNALHELLDAINPICKDEWVDKKWYGKIYLIVKVLSLLLSKRFMVLLCF